MKRNGTPRGDGRPSASISAEELMDDIARDGSDFAVSNNGQLWRVAWWPPPEAPPGTPHGAAAVCVTDDRIVLVSRDGEWWGLPGGRPKPHERWVDTLRREVAEEGCAQVTSCRLLGFSRGVCVRGQQRGLVLVRSMWRAEVRLERWKPRAEMARRLVPADEALRSLTTAEGDMTPLYRRMFVEAHLPTDSDDRPNR
ncbi:MAG: NUDIX domain-containing protein [Streptosporangiales bacterium]|nr:NUDIX domain-containing protein [Streptosporangiales bacterium]